MTHRHLQSILSKRLGQYFFAALNKSIDNARLAGSEGFLHDVADLVGMIDPETQSPHIYGQLRIVRVARQIGSHITVVKEIHLVFLLWDASAGLVSWNSTRLIRCPTKSLFLSGRRPDVPNSFAGREPAL